MDDTGSFLTPFFTSLRESIASGWAAWERFGEVSQELRLPLGPRARAAFVYDHIVDAARQRFDRMDGVQVRDDKGFLVLVIAQGDLTYLIRFKKLNAKGRASQIFTKQQRQWFSLQMRFPDMPEAERLIAGYKLDPFGVGLEDILLTKQTRYQVLWQIALPEAAEPEAPVVPLIRPVSPAPAEVSSSLLKDETGEQSDE